MTDERAEATESEMTSTDFPKESPSTETSTECMSFIKCTTHASAHFQKGYVGLHEINEVLQCAVPLAFVYE